MRLEIIRSILIWKLLYTDNPIFANGPNGSGYTTAAKLVGASKDASSLCCRGAHEPKVLGGFENPVAHEEVPMCSLKTAALGGGLINESS